MEDLDDVNEIFAQDGVLLKQASAQYINFVNSTGTLYITENKSPKKSKCLEWKPLDITVDSDIQDQEWAVVNTVQKRFRTLSGSLPPDYHNRLRLRIKFSDIHSFKTSNKNRQMTFLDGKGETISSFLFQQTCELLAGRLQYLLKTVPSKRDKHLFYVQDGNNEEIQQIDKSFAELQLTSDSRTIWRLVKNFTDQPYEATFEAFSKVTDFVYRSPEQREIDEAERQALSRSLTEFDNSNTAYDLCGYEESPFLPKRKEFPRLKPLNKEQWMGHIDYEGRIEDVEAIKNLIFRGGVTPSLRCEVWKYLLDYYPWTSTEAERKLIAAAKKDEYFAMKLQWKTITKVQEDNFSDFRERKSLIEKDVNRTDRNLEFFAGDNNTNLVTLYDILMSYVMYNFDLGYVQGMSDLLSPILMLLKDEVEAFWCFVGFMNKVVNNFDVDQAGMKEQLTNLRTIVSFMMPKFGDYLDKHESGNLFFCFRWLLVWYKRELCLEDIMRLWEVMWTGSPCENFHLLIATAILETEMNVIMEREYGFTEILKHINELNGRLDISMILNKAEGIFYQMIESDRLTNSIRLILGLPPESNNTSGSHESSPFEENSSTNNSQPSCSVDVVNISPDDVTFDNCINMNYL